MRLAVAILLCASTASADVSSLRAPSVGRTVGVELGYPTSSVSVWINDWIGAGAYARIPLSAVGVQLGLRRTFVGDPRQGWGFDGIAAFGIEFTTVTVALVAKATGSLGVRYVGESFVTAIRATAPISLRFTDDLQVKLPILAEVWLGGKAGGVWVALHGALGPAFIVGYQPTPSIQLGVVLTLEF